MIGADIVRPSLGWLLTGGKKRKLARNMIYSRDAEGFARLSQFCEQDAGVTDLAGRHILFRTAVIIAAKGGKVADITIGDVLEVLDSRPVSVARDVQVRRPSGCCESWASSVQASPP